MRRRLLAIVVALAAAVPGLVSVAPAAHATTCAGSSGKYVSGSYGSQDHRYLNVQIGLTVVDRYGHTINLAGCRTSGYTKSIFLNTSLSYLGAYRGVGGWSIGPLPTNAVSVWVETYPRTNTPKPCATCDGPVDLARYGMTYRRAIPVGSYVHLLAPLLCGLGGSTGAITGSLYPAGFTRVMAWSAASNPALPIEGWGEGGIASGHFQIPALASGQPYVVWATYNGVTYKKEVNVYACRTSVLNFAA